jgi:hypothetical protein
MQQNSLKILGATKLAVNVPCIDEQSCQTQEIAKPPNTGALVLGDFVIPLEALIWGIFSLVLLTVGLVLLVRGRKTKK